jgi:hypothetical protein
VDPDVELLDDPDVEPLDDPDAEPLVDPDVELPDDPDAEPLVDPDVDPPVDPDVEPLADPDAEPLADPDVDPLDDDPFDDPEDPDAEWSKPASTSLPPVRPPVLMRTVHPAIPPSHQTMLAIAAYAPRRAGETLFLTISRYHHARQPPHAKTRCQASVGRRVG